MLIIHLRARVIIRKRSKDISGTPAASSPKDEERDFQHDRQLIFRAISAWDAEYIPLACPLVSCTLIGPFAANVCAALAHDRSTIYIDMLKLVLERIGQYWDIGSGALSLFPSFHLRSPSHPTSGTVTTNTFGSL
jgi:hypothetical protein